MDQDVVDQLEKEIEDAIVEIMHTMGMRRVLLQPSPQTMHLMAKAAVTVYETACENHKPR